MGSGQSGGEPIAGNKLPNSQPISRWPKAAPELPRFQPTVGTRLAPLIVVSPGRGKQAQPNGLNGFPVPLARLVLAESQKNARTQLACLA